jgi:hypothetical protein
MTFGCPHHERQNLIFFLKDTLLAMLPTAENMANQTFEKDGVITKIFKYLDTL